MHNMEKRTWELIKYKKDQHWIQTDLMQISTKEKYSVINIYAPNHYKEKVQCWDTLKEALKGVQDGKIILG